MTAKRATQLYDASNREAAQVILAESIGITGRRRTTEANER